MSVVVEALGVGFAFGWLLNKAGLTHYARIVNVYRLRDWTVLRFMLSALLVGAVCAQLAVDLELGAAAPLPLTAPLANLVGGAVFGVGMASAGYCPGTIAAEAGEGRWDAWVAGFCGLLAGALLFGVLEPKIMPLLRREPLGHVSLASLVGASPWLVLLVFGELVLLALLLTDRRSAEHDPES